MRRLVYKLILVIALDLSANPLYLKAIAHSLYKALKERPLNLEDPKAYFARHVFICTNQRVEGHSRGCCLEKGSLKLRNYLKARVKELGLPGLRINTAGCLDRCELGPTMVVYPEGVWYRFASADDLEEILQNHLVANGRVERLMLKPDQKRQEE